MIYPTHLKERAVKLRREGFSYSEILNFIHVSQSTLSSWLQGVVLSQEQLQRLERLKRRGQIRGAQKRHTDRVLTTESIQATAIAEIGELSPRELMLIGASLYWAEGSKKSATNPGSGLIFTNQDPEMIKMFLLFLNQTCRIQDHMIRLEIYIHETHTSFSHRAITYWSNITRIPIERIKVYSKRNAVSKDRQNTRKSYYGTLRVKVSTSSALVRKINGWVCGMVKNCGVV